MTELNMYPTRSFVRIKATYTNRIPSGGVSYALFRHFVLLKKYIVYGQGPIAWYLMRYYVSSASACADPGMLQSEGGGGVESIQAHLTVKSSDSVVLLFLLFFSPHLQLIEQFYRGDRSQGPMVYFLENKKFPRFQRGSNISRGGGGGGGV